MNLAVKYRPVTFSDVVGQTPVVKTLGNIVKDNNKGKAISQAYIFHGSHGTGKTTVARLFSKGLNCEEFKDDLCGECESCKTKDTTDISEMDGATSGLVANIRELKEFCSYRPFFKYKVVIIDEVHRVSKEGFDALLKLIEEPPDYVVFVFCTTEFRFIPTTIVSRCILFEFKNFSQKELIDRLKYVCDKENIKYQDEALDLVAVHSEGAMRDALTIVDQVSKYKDGFIDVDSLYVVLGLLRPEFFMGLFEIITRKAMSELLTQLDFVSESGVSKEEFVLQLIDFMRVVIFDKMGIMTTKKSFYIPKGFNYNISLNSLVLLYDSFILALEKIKNNRYIGRYLIESIFLKVFPIYEEGKSIIKAVQKEEIVKKLDTQVVKLKNKIF